MQIWYRFNAHFIWEEKKYIELANSYNCYYNPALVNDFVSSSDCNAQLLRMVQKKKKGGNQFGGFYFPLSSNSSIFIALMGLAVSRIREGKRYISKIYRERQVRDREGERREGDNQKSGICSSLRHGKVNYIDNIGKLILIYITHHKERERVSNKNFDSFSRQNIPYTGCSKKIPSGIFRKV